MSDTQSSDTKDVTSKRTTSDNRIYVMRQVQAVLKFHKAWKGGEVKESAVCCVKCGRADSIKPMIRGDGDVWLWCGRCREYSPVDTAAVEAAEAGTRRRPECRLFF